jgi:hypothetical protein
MNEKNEGAGGAPRLNAELAVTPHAVRWAKRDVKCRFETEYSLWHWTTDACLTLCNRPILLIQDGPAMLPESNDDASTVTCRRCAKLLTANI